MRTWITGENGNRASVEFWGSEEAAKASLATLTNCSGCSDCSRCLDCWDCYRCSGCLECLGCSDCWDCYRCSGCLECLGCLECSRCSDCSGCSGCSGCWDCLRCSSRYRASDLTEEEPAFEVPVIEDIHKKVYAAACEPNALDMSDWHKCETTHCRAGWVVHLAGKAGYELEERTSSVFAAIQIYRGDPDLQGQRLCDLAGKVLRVERESA